MKKKKRLFGSLTKRPDGSNLKHKKKYIELETRSYSEEDYDADYEDEEYYDESDYESEDYDEEYYEDEDEEYPGEEYPSDEEYYDEEYYDEDEYYEDEEYLEADEYYDEDYDEDEEVDEEYYEEEQYEESYEEPYEDDQYIDDGYSKEDEYEDYAEYDNSEEYYDYEDEYVDDYEEKKVKAPKSKNRSNERMSFKEWLLFRLYNLDFMDVVLTITTVMLLVFVGLTISAVTATNNVEEATEEIVPIGQSLSTIGVVGETGLQAMTEAGAAGQLTGIEAATTETASTENSDSSEASEQPQKAQISVSFESIEKDLKIRFKNSLTNALITGAAFEVTITNKATGNSLTLVDDDMDGVIYKSGIKAGKFNAVIASTSKYRFPTDPQEITIKDKVQYVVINVEDEVKQENEIEVAKEDTEVKVAATEKVEATTTLTNTVEFVNSTKVGSDPTYTKIDKSTIADPSQKASIKASQMKFDDFTFDLEKSEVEVEKDQTVTVKVTTSLNSSETDDKKVSYEGPEWRSADETIAKVDSEGKITGISKGTVNVTCKYKQITQEKEKKTEKVREEENKKQISVEEYEGLSDEEKKHCKEITEKATDDDGKEIDKITGYDYIPETTKETSDWGDKKTEECTKTVKVTVTVPPAKLKSATLELDQKDLSIAKDQVVTIKPAKMVYEYDDGTNKTITSDFPTVSWESADSSIATVTSAGEIKGIKVGSTTIKAVVTNLTNANGDKITASCNVSVVEGMTLTLNKTGEQTIKVGDTLQIQPTVNNYKETSAVLWSTSDEKIATVTIGGLVTGVAPGTATMTATTQEKSAVTGKQLTQTVTIKVISKETAAATTDKTSKLKDKSGNQVYIKNSNGAYVEAVYADYYTATEFYIMNAQTFRYTGWQTIGGKTYYYDKDGKVVTGTQVIQGEKYEFNSDGSLKNGNNNGVRGIDVSKWNGSIDWAAVKNSGIDYVIIRCGYRGSASGAMIEDPNFKTNIQGATAAGIKVGVYFFSQAIDEVEAVKEASFAISLVQGYKLTYPIFIDTEKSGGRADSLSQTQRTEIVSAFCQTVENAGYKAGIYASQTWFETKLTASNLAKYKIWIARYTNQITYSGKYDMWQYTAKGTCSGISGNVDYNYSYLGY